MNELMHMLAQIFKLKLDDNLLLHIDISHLAKLGATVTLKGVVDSEIDSMNRQYEELCFTHMEIETTIEGGSRVTLVMNHKEIGSFIEAVKKLYITLFNEAFDKELNEELSK